jgi:hypothetical protein
VDIDEAELVQEIPILGRAAQDAYRSPTIDRGQDLGRES